MERRIGWGRGARVLAILLAIAPFVAACGPSGTGATVRRAAFTSDEFGVKVSPRVTNSANPRKGGGRYLVGKPYQVRGKWYTPEENPSYTGQGTASWYGSDFHGRLTANGEIFSANAITGAHPTLPLPSYVRVTNLDNGRSLVVRVNDRGPYISGRLMDISHRAADMLGFVHAGSAHVQVAYVGPAPLSGDDTRALLRTFHQHQELGGRTYIATADPRQGPTSLADMAGEFFSAFGYVEGEPIDSPGQEQAILDAHDAVTAMATRAGALEDWVDAVDVDARAIRLQLGIFADPNLAFETAREFALLGAVDQEEVTASGEAATRLTLTYLKPGVMREDVLQLARALGLKDLILY